MSFIPALLRNEAAGRDLWVDCPICEHTMYPQWYENHWRQNHAHVHPKVGPVILPVSEAKRKSVELNKHARGNLEGLRLKRMATKTNGPLDMASIRLIDLGSVVVPDVPPELLVARDLEKYPCLMCGDSFLTPELAHDHLEKVHRERDPWWVRLAKTLLRLDSR